MSYKNLSSSMFQYSLDPIIIENLEGVVTEMNPQAEKIYGFKRAELIGKQIIEIIPPEGHEQAKDLLRRTIDGEEVRDIEGIRWTKNGNRLPVLLALTPIYDEQLNLIAIATIAKDLTGLKEAAIERERLAQVFKDSTDPIILEDMNGTIIEVNKEAVRSYGFSRNVLIGESIRMLVPPERHPQALELLERCLSGETIRNVEGLRWTSDGRIIDVLLTLSALKNEEGGISAIATIAKDITVLKKTENALKEERELLEIRVGERTHELLVAQKELTRLADKLSHYLAPQIYKSIFEGKSSDSISSKRKWLTVFFSDIAGFTSTTESLDSEVLTLLLNEYFSEMSKIVFKYGGTLDKYIGDAIMVFFGDPDTEGREKDAVACVSMALEMQKQTEALAGRWKRRGYLGEFNVRCGISSGFCTVGNFGSEKHMNYTCFGRHVNLANRIESAANNGQVLVSDTTRSLIKKNFGTSPLSPIKAKGFKNPVGAHLVLGHNDMLDTQSVYQRAHPGVNLWIDPKEMSDEVRKDTIMYLKQIIDSIEKD